MQRNFQLPLNDFRVSLQIGAHIEFDNITHHEDENRGEGVEISMVKFTAIEVNPVKSIPLSLRSL